MATIVFLGSFLAGSLLTVLIPIGLLIALAIWHTNSIRNIPGDPSETAPHAAGAAETEGRRPAETEGHRPTETEGRRPAETEGRRPDAADASPGATRP